MGVSSASTEIRPHNRSAIEGHTLADLISLIEGNSIAPDVISHVSASIGDTGNVLVILDSNHSRAHVLAELQAYAALIGAGGHIVVADGNLASLVGLPGAKDDWSWDNPEAAIAEFLAARIDFERVSPPVAFNERGIAEGVSYWPGGYLRRIR